MSPTCPTHLTRQGTRFRKGIPVWPTRSRNRGNGPEGLEQGLRLTFTARLGSVRGEKARDATARGAAVRRAELPGFGAAIRLGTAGLPQRRRCLAEDAETNGAASGMKTSRGRARPGQP